MAMFSEKLEKRWAAGARVCIGLDSEWEKLPDYFQRESPQIGQSNFNKRIIDATKDLALAYKPNIAFYCGDKDGYYYQEMQRALSETIDYIHWVAPDVPVILDTKDADIGNTNHGSVRKAFLHFKADALTVHNYLGMEAMKPFLDQKDKGIIVLCRTSNPGASEFQDAILIAADPPNRSMPLYQFVAERVVNHWNYNGNCGLVVGATAPEQLRRVRRIVGDDMWLLIPGIGKQGGDLEKSVQNGINGQGRGIIINSSSGIIFASRDPDFAQAAYNETKKLTDGINAAMKPGSLVDKKV